MAVQSLFKARHQIAVTYQGFHRVLGISAAEHLTIFIGDHKAYGGYCIA